MPNEKNDNVTKKPAVPPDVKTVEKVPDQINSADARKAEAHGAHPVSREQDEIGTKAPVKE